MIRLITDNDLDGISCYIVLKVLRPNDEIKVTFCKNYAHVNNLVLRTLENIDEFDHLYITDLSVSEYVAEKIEKVNKEKGKVLLLDHHKTAEWLNKYPWACVMIDHIDCKEDSDKYCGSELFRDFLSLSSNIRNNKLDEYIELVRRYDTWEWKTKYDDQIPSDLNAIYKVKGKSDFISSVMRSINKNEELFDEFDKKLLDIEKSRINDYVSKKNNDIEVLTVKGYKVGVLFAEQYISELGNRLSELHPELDLIAMIGQKAISYRTTKDDIDVSEFAKMFGGGGHKSSSGSPIKKSDLRKLMIQLFKNK